MSEKQIKRFRKSIEGLDPASYNRVIKMFKKSKVVAWMCNNTPKRPALLSKKIHPGESFKDLKLRRKECNQRQRDREDVQRRTLTGETPWSDSFNADTVADTLALRRL